MVVNHEPRMAGNKVPLKLTSLNFELMAGLPMADGPGLQGLSVGAASGAPNSVGGLGATSGVQPTWNPMSAGHDSFFLPQQANNKQIASARNGMQAPLQPNLHPGGGDQRKGSARTQHQTMQQFQQRFLDPRPPPM